MERELPDMSNEREGSGEMEKRASSGREAFQQNQPPERQNLDFILDLSLEISVELGKTKMLIGDLLQLGQGSVIELTKMAGEPVEILVNQKLIARGEVVTVNEKFGVRLTDILSPSDRLKQLGE
jgi:flagellar motor switch protein FliN/FliY